MFTSILRALVFLVLFGGALPAFAGTPTATTSAATNLTTSSAMLNGVGTPNGSPTTGWFRYSTTNPGSCDNSFGTRVPTTGGTDLGAGTGAVPYSITTTGLSPGTTYYFCALVSNSSGTAFGTVLSFTIPAPPLVVTTGVTSLTSTSATLQGSAIPYASPTLGSVRYSTSNPGTCNSTFGDSTYEVNLGSGTTAVPFGISLGLTPATTYYYCAFARNAYGTSNGALISFTTPPSLPRVTTNPVLSATGHDAVLSGSVVPGGAATTAWFRYSATNTTSCDDSFGTRAPSSGGIALGSGMSAVDFSQSISGLSPGTSYWFCAIAVNAAGTAYGNVYSVGIPSLPNVTTAGAGVSISTATFNGYADTNGASTTGWFRYSTSSPGTCNDSFGTRAPSTGGMAIPNGSYHSMFYESVSGLSADTTYYYCALAGNVVGTVVGAVMSIRTPGLPSVATAAATSITTTGATLNGSGNPDGDSAEGFFRYSTTNPGSCNNSFGTAAPNTYNLLGNGTTAVPFSATLYGLSPATTYYFCALDFNGYGNSYGAVLSFTTPAALPQVTTNAPTTTTGTGAVLSGSANPGGAATTGWFRYSATSPGTCNDSFGTRAPFSGGSALGSGNSAVAFTQTIAGLLPNTTYYVCAIAANSGGTAFGAVLSFITPSPPTVMTQPASSLTSSAATISGGANPNRATTTGWFRYSATNPGTCNDSFGSRAPVSGGSPLGNGSSSINYYQVITGLSAGSTYYFCALASSSEGTAVGAVLSFTTAASPSVTTTAATGITSTTATFNGSANPNGGTANGWFRYSTTNPGSCNDSFGTHALYDTGLGYGTTAMPYSSFQSGLTPATTYYFCAIANNSYGTSFGTVLSFTTLAATPTVSTLAPTTITGKGAVLSGSANPGGANATGWFRYSAASPGTCNDSFGTRAPSSGGAALGSGTSTVSFTQAISGLSPNTTYYFCAIAANSSGNGFGAVMSFLTPSPPTVTTAAASSLSSTSAILNGTANPNSAATTGWFRYSATNPGTCNDSFGSRAPVTGGSSLGSGIYSTTYYQSISGLSPATTYYFCAIASSSEGTAFGTVLTFSTATTPKVITVSSTGITATTATLNGSANPNGGSTTAWFRYSTTNPGSCSDSFGTLTGGSGLGSGTSSVAYTASTSSLSPSTTYYFCAIASNPYGSGYGAIMSFTTTAATPTVSTSNPTSITGTTAVLAGSANPGGASATGWFRYSMASPGTCNDTFGTRAPGSGGSSLGSGNSTVSYSQSISGLTKNTTYYYCAIAGNSAGTGYGYVYSFTTPAAPTVATVAASGVYTTSANLNGTANPNSAATTGWFRYSTTSPGTCNDTFGSRAPVSGGSSLGSGIYSTSYYQTISGLSAATTYYYCAIASNSEGTSLGTVLSFTTPTVPKVTTVSATGIAANSATLNGTANPNGASTNGWFRYGTTNPGTCSDSFGYSSISSSLGAGTSAIAYSQLLTGLSPGTTYYYCAVANNTSGNGYGALMSFTTAAGLPVVSTDATANVTTVAATLNGDATPNGAATTGWFRYSATSPGSCNDSFGTRAPSSSGTALGAGSASVAFSQSISGLTTGTTYYSCAIGSNSVGIAFGNLRSFTTQAAPAVTTLAATPVTASTATLNGSANPNGYSTTGWFRYSKTNPGSCNDSFGTRLPSSSGVGLGSVSYSVGYSQSLVGLSAATPYYFCAIASSTVGTSFGGVLSFTTPASVTDTPTAPASFAPSTRAAAIPVTTLAATAITTGSAVLSGSATPIDSATLGWFRYDATDPGSCSDSFGTRAPAGYGAPLGSAASAATFAQALTELVPGTTYYYCAIAAGPQGMSFGKVLSFVVGEEAPNVATQAAAEIAPTSAKLAATVQSSGSTATVWFRYGDHDPGTCDDSFGSLIAVPAGAADAASVPLQGLKPSATYYYCAAASNLGGARFGQVLSFTTASDPAAAKSTAEETPSTGCTYAGRATNRGSLPPLLNLLPLAGLLLIRRRRRRFA